MEQARRWWLIGLLLTVLGVGLLVGACGKSLEKDRDHAQHAVQGWAEDPKRSIVAVPLAGGGAQEQGPRDPDGLLHRLDGNLHPFLAELRIDAEVEDHILLIFRSAEGVRLRAADLNGVRLIEEKGGVLTVRVAHRDVLIKAVR